MVANARILIVEDERIVSLDLRHQLMDLGYEITADADSGEKAVELALSDVPDLILMDIHLAGEMDGVTAASMIHQHIDVPIVFATAYADNETLARAKVTQPYGYIIKPIDSRELQIAVAIALQLHKSHRRYVVAEEKLRRQSDELRQALREVQRLEEMKGQFVRNASHELRTPLSLILGYAEMLVDGDFGDLAPGQQPVMEIISRRANELRLMIEDMSLLLEVSEESADIQRQRVELASVLDHVVSEWQSKVQLAGLSFESSVEPNLPAIAGDPVQLHRIFAHLLSNAVKFTPVGGTVSVIGSSDEKHVKVTVEDTGMGIPKDELSLIFKRFYQVDGSSTRKYPGMGLGLAVVKEAVEALGGEVDVQSILGRGSSFTVILPLCQHDTLFLGGTLVSTVIEPEFPTVEHTLTEKRVDTTWIVKA